jgi:Dirigent-like protein
MTNRRNRLALGLAAAAATSVTAAAMFAGPGAAQSGGTELHLTGTLQKNVGFFPKGHTGPGSRFGFGQKITGDDSGVSRSVCTIVGGSGGLPCTIWVKLSKGTLELQGMSPEKARNTPIAVVGGTGAYNGARGTAFATDKSQTKSSIVVELLP